MLPPRAAAHSAAPTLCARMLDFRLRYAISPPLILMLFSIVAAAITAFDAMFSLLPAPRMRSSAAQREQSRCRDYFADYAAMISAD
jgi:hypothetical protein